MAKLVLESNQHTYDHRHNLVAKLILKLDELKHNTRSNLVLEKDRDTHEHGSMAKIVVLESDHHKHNNDTISNIVPKLERLGHSSIIAFVLEID